jgi:DNA-binding NarL/FixJ family response regulator
VGGDRCLAVRLTSSADSTSHRPATARRVAVVSRDELLVRRVRDALARDGVTVTAGAADVAGLPEAATDAGAILLAGFHSVVELRGVIRTAHARFPGLPSVIVASLSNPAMRKALETGACGIVLEADIEDALPATLRAVCAHQIVVPKRLHRQAIRVPLSHREKQTLALVVRGLTNREIADSLFLAESTVKTHLSSAFRRLGVGSRREAAALMRLADNDMRRQLLPAPPRPVPGSVALAGGAGLGV